MRIRKVIKKWLVRLVRFLPTAVFLALLMPIAVVSLREGEKAAGLIPVVVPVVGTGSMYPSLFWDTASGGPEDPTKTTIAEYRTDPEMYFRFPGVTVFGRTYLKRPVGFGDMVAFKNATTATILKQMGQDPSAGFIKRVIGLPGDTIQFRDGYVIRNGTTIAEPYIAAARSTYGGSGFADCQSIAVPPGSYLVLGDNRKISDDSRGELGLIKEGDISYVLPYSDQALYKPLWRDTSKDASLAGKPELDTAKFVSLVNTTRRTHHVGNLASQPALAKSATLRADHIIEGATSYSMKNSTAEAGYTNILTGEFVSHGVFTAEELLANLLYYPSTAKEILDGEYQDIGIAAVVGNVNGCPTQVVVGQLGGYIPASYDQATVDSWVQAKTSLEDSLASWSAAKNYPNINQDELNNLLTVLSRRLSLATEIVTAMQNKAWLTADQQARIKADAADATTVESLAQSLNGGQ